MAMMNVSSGGIGNQIEKERKKERKNNEKRLIFKKKKKKKRESSIDLPPLRFTFVRSVLSCGLVPLSPFAFVPACCTPTRPHTHARTPSTPVTHSRLPFPILHHIRHLALPLSLHTPTTTITIPNTSSSSAPRAAPPSSGAGKTRIGALEEVRGGGGGVAREVRLLKLVAPHGGLPIPKARARRELLVLVLLVVLLRRCVLLLVVVGRRRRHDILLPLALLLLLLLLLRAPPCCHSHGWRLPIPKGRVEQPARRLCVLTYGGGGEKR
jgi:hypothetical protein